MPAVKDVGSHCGHCRASFDGAILAKERPQGVLIQRRCEEPEVGSVTDYCIAPRDFGLL
jgi:hypothetical protein